MCSHFMIWKLTVLNLYVTWTLTILQLWETPAYRTEVSKIKLAVVYTVYVALKSFGIEMVSTLHIAIQ